MSRLSGRSSPRLGLDPHYEALTRELYSALNAGRDGEAERAARMLADANPREHAAWHAIATVALRAANPSQAVEAAERAHQLDRKNASYLNTLGVAYEELGRTTESIVALKRAIKLRPAYTHGHYNLGKVFERHGQLSDARESYQRAVLIDPTHAAAKHNLARVLRRLGESEAALTIAMDLHSQQPEDVDRMIGLAFALADSRGTRAGVQFLDTCLERSPQTTDLHGERAGMLFTLGEWGAAWSDYLWRPGVARSPDAFPARLPDELSGRVVLLLPDQGLGDMLFFLRFARLIRMRSGKAVFASPPKLAPLLRGHPDLDYVVTPDVCLPESEMSLRVPILLGDLPFVLKAETAEPPFRVSIREDVVREWRDRLLALGPPPYVGLTWRAGTDFRMASAFVDRPAVLSKEIPLDLLAQVVRPVAGTLLSVQRLPGAGERERLAALAGRAVHDFSAANDGLEQMAGLLTLLEEYVGVSNTNMHLRAGIGQVGEGAGDLIRRNSGGPGRATSSAVVPWLLYTVSNRAGLG